MISEVKAYILYGIWVSEASAVESAKENDWIEYEGKHYCPDCYTEGENGDDDEIQIIKEREGKYD